MKNLFKVFGIIALVAVIGFSMAGCASTEGLPYNVEVENQNISRYENSRDFISGNYADAYRAAVRAGYTQILHIEKVKLGPFGIFGTQIRVTARQP